MLKEATRPIVSQPTVYRLRSASQRQDRAPLAPEAEAWQAPAVSVQALRQDLFFDQRNAPLPDPPEVVAACLLGGEPLLERRRILWIICPNPDILRSMNKSQVHSPITVSSRIPGACPGSSIRGSRDPCRGRTLPGSLRASSRHQKQATLLSGRVLQSNGDHRRLPPSRRPRQAARYGSIWPAFEGPALISENVRGRAALLGIPCEESIDRC